MICKIINISGINKQFLKRSQFLSQLEIDCYFFLRRKTLVGERRRKAPLGVVFGIDAGQRGLVEDGAVAAVHETRVVVDAGDELGRALAGARRRHGEARVRQEQPRQRFHGDRRQIGAPETDHLCSRPPKRNTQSLTGGSSSQSNQSFTFTFDTLKRCWFK